MRTYRELSIKYHPDKNPESAELFGRIRDAYEILSDPVKMLLYDTGGMDLVKKYEKDGDGEIERVDNFEVNHEISLEEAYKGGEKEITVNRRVVCRSCRLRPELPRCRKCQACPGERRQRQVWMDQWHYRIEEYEVPSDERCTWDRQKLKLQIERGTMWGPRMEVRKSPVFKRLGDDLMADVHVSLSEATAGPDALLGFERQLVHLDGHVVRFSMPRGDARGTQGNEVLKPGSALQIEGEGMPHKEEKTRKGTIFETGPKWMNANPKVGRKILQYAFEGLGGRQFIISELSSQAAVKGSKAIPFEDKEDEDIDAALSKLPGQADSLVLLEGKTETSPSTNPSNFLAFGEAAFLGVPLSALSRAARPPRTGRAKVFRRADLQSVLDAEERRCLERFAREAQLAVGLAGEVQEQERLLAFLEAGRHFRGCSSNFMRNFWDDAALQLLAPHDALGQGVHLVLSGRLALVAPDGVLLRYAGPGEVLLVVPGANTTVSARKGPVLCACVALPGPSEPNSDDLEIWWRNVDQLVLEEKEALEERRTWVRQVALPALSATQLLAGCPEEFLQRLAGQLTEETFQEYEEIVQCNSEGNSMLVVLEGLVELRARSGKQIGCVGPTAHFGEPEALQLLPKRTITATALSPCRIMPISSEVLLDALKDSSTPAALREGFQQLVANRRKQVQEHLPLSSLMRLKCNEEDAGANLLALRAERLPLEPNDGWLPTPDGDPNGPRFSLVLRGRVQLELTGNGQPVEVHVRTGSVLAEGMLAQRGATLRALSADCEVYRLWQYDLLQAAFISNQAPDWFYQLRVLEQDTRRWLQCRLTNARGLLQQRGRHPADDLIRGWAKKKQENLRRAQERQEQFAENYLGPKLPLLPPKKLGTTAFRSWGDLPKPTLKPSKGPGPSPSAFRALRLVHSEPKLR
ncbi:unnamed protein product [Durusdinium trenchii]|uniref:Uncharacterized protein n=1 Tax=Durusdinium trenchii TaxID=1381693 RepID=A0ABP0SL63_9DINO